MSRISRITALAATITALSAVGAQASPIGSLPASSATNTSCLGFTVWQHSPSFAQSTSTIVTSWSTYQSAGASGRTLRLKVLHPMSAGVWKVVAEAPVFDVGTTEGVKTQAVSLTIAPGDFIALFGNNADCYFSDGSASQLDGNNGGEPAVGDDIGDSAGVSPSGLVLDAQFAAEPDADGDGFGDETQDTCPGQADVHTGPCTADPSVTATVTPATIGVGDLAVMTGTVANAGPSSATGAVLNAIPSAGLDVVSSLPAAGCTVTTSLACPLGSLAKDASLPFVVVVKATSVGAKTLTATVATTSSDPNAANNSAGGSIMVEQRVPLVCTVPSLKGLSKAIAKRLLSAVHCKLGKVTKKKAKKGKRGTVIKQAKKAKAVLPAGSKVNVTLKK